MDETWILGYEYMVFYIRSKATPCAFLLFLFCSGPNKTDGPVLLEGDGSMFKADLIDHSTAGRNGGVLVSGSACKGPVSFNC